MKYLVSLEPHPPVPAGCRLSGVVMSMSIILPGHVITSIIFIIVMIMAVNKILISDDFQYDFEYTFQTLSM